MAAERSAISEAHPIATGRPPAGATDTPPPRGARLRGAWTLAGAAALAATLLAASARGHGARREFNPPPEIQGKRLLALKDAAEAFVVWRAERLRGRHLVLLTGQWSRPPRPPRHPRTLEEMERERGGAGVELDAASALFLAANVGIARRMDVVMPAAALAQRLAEVAGRKELRREGQSFRLPSNGFDRRFSSPDDFVAPEEPVLVLVEPSWFTEGAPADPLAWLAAKGVRSDLAVVALGDPAATTEARAAAEAYATDLGAVRAEVGP